MEESSELSTVFPRVLTQDESPLAIDEVANGGLTMRSVLDTFVLPGDMSPSASAQFVTCAVNHADKTQIEFQSPARKLLYRRHQLVDDDTAMPDSEKKLLKTAISKGYIKTYTGISRQPSMVTPQPSTLLLPTNNPSNRKLNFEPTQAQSSSVGSLPSITTDVVSSSSKQVPTPAQIRTKWHEHDPHDTFDSVLDAMAYMEKNYQSFKHGGKRVHKIPKGKKTTIQKKNTKLPGTYVEYRCQLSDIKAGNCRGRIFHESRTKLVVLKIVTYPDCKCLDYKRVRRGLGALGQKHYDNVMMDEPNGTTKTNTNKIICRMVKETTIDTSTHVARTALKNQIKNHRKYCKKVERETSLMQIPILGNLLDFKQQHTFHVPKDVPTDLSEERHLELYGTTMYREEKLPVIFSEEVDPLDREKEAYRSMILLDGAPDPEDTDRSDAENRLYKRIEELQQQKTNSPHIPAYAETTVFSSLALLWNLKECEELDFEVTGSAD